MSNPEFTKWVYNTEALLRGTYLRMAVDAQFMLAMIIADIYKHNKDEINTHIKKDKTTFKGLHEFTMEETITVAKLALNKYKQSIFNQYKDEIEDLNILRDERNIYAHSKMDFHEHKRDLVTISTLVNKVKVKQTTYRISDLKVNILEHHKKVSHVLNLLMVSINPAPLDVE